MGQAADGLTSEVELIDLLDPSHYCILPNFPHSVEGGFGSPNTLTFCGGHNFTDSSRDCLSLKGSTWEKTSEMMEKRYFLSLSPLQKHP